MKLAPVKTPIIAKKVFPKFVWDQPSSEKTIYLTFDDGPTPEITDWTLNVLKQFDAKATFFCVGKNIKNHSDIFKNILENGHSVGNHTWNHIKGWRTPTKAYLENIDEAQILIDAYSNNYQSQSKKLFRPPYGQIKLKQAKALDNLGFSLIMWNVLSFDWDKTIPKESCLNNVINNASNGSIIVFHDSIKAQKNMSYALPKVLQHFTQKGYKFKAITC